jgi:3-methyl-2-oxobutanoate hydroxymethyltransferase
MTIEQFVAKKKKREPIVMLTCYESWAARLLNDSPIDAVLVGDSVAMVMYGQSSTLSATVDLMAEHTSAVARRMTKKLIVADMPFLSYRTDLKSSVLAAGQLMRAGAQAIKLEGARGNLELIRHLVDSGIPVMGHLGLTPQSVHTLSGYKVQGRDTVAAESILMDALALESAGCFSVVLECVPSALAKKISLQLQIPTIGIGAGADTDGQILVWHDLLGLQTEIQPKFVRTYLNAAQLIAGAVENYCQDVKTKQFPSAAESFE